jgi:hypothetical protein
MGWRRETWEGSPGCSEGIKQMILEASRFGKTISQHGFHLRLMLAEAQCFGQQKAGNLASSVLSLQLYA